MSKDHGWDVHVFFFVMCDWNAFAVVVDLQRKKFGILRGGENKSGLAYVS